MLFLRNETSLLLFIITSFFAFPRISQIVFSVTNLVTFVQCKRIHSRRQNYYTFSHCNLSWTTGNKVRISRARERNISSYLYTFITNTFPYRHMSIHLQNHLILIMWNRGQFTLNHCMSQGVQYFLRGREENPIGHEVEKQWRFHRTNSTDYCYNGRKTNQRMCRVSG